MKQILTIVVLILVSTAMNAQSSIEKEVGDFTTLKTYDLLNVEMIKSDANKVIIKGADPYDVELVNRNGTLKIRMDPEKSFDGDNTFVTLYYKAVDVIDANEGSQIVVKDLIDQYEIDLKTQEGAEIEAELQVTYANFKAVTGGIVTVKGTAKNQDVSVYTGGVFEGEELETEFSEVRFHGDTERAKKVYQGLQPLTPDDVADTVFFCATRPAHVNINDVILMPVDQASATLVNRQT